MIIAGLLILILAIVTTVGALTAFQLPEAITEQGERTVVLYEVTLAVSFVIFFAVTAGIIYAIFRFKRVDNTIPPQIHGSPLVEYGGVLFAVIVLVALFIPALALVIDLKTQPDREEAGVTIGVVGHQWWWEFDYENGVKVQATPPNYDELIPPTLVVPVGTTVLLKIRSTDVIHSFYAPNLLYKIQAIPGNVNEMHFKAKKIGTYTGQCYQFCGLRHADMRWNLQVMSQSDYDKWLSDQKNAAPAPRTEAQPTIKTTDLATSASSLFTTPIKGSE
jgi:cytochrome c oxidase subunit 2